MISKLCTLYLKLLEATSRIEVRGLEAFDGDFLAGFWHGDSLAMQLLLKKAAERGVQATAVITADRRGDTIEKVIRSCKGEVFRLSYESGGLLQAVRQLYSLLRRDGGNLATAMDGPLGPPHRPKRFLFSLASRTGQDFLAVGASYNWKVRLGRRWDKYVIPLPFGKILFTVHNLGPITRERLEDFSGLCREIRSKLAVEDQAGQEMREAGCCL